MPTPLTRTIASVILRNLPAMTFRSGELPVVRRVRHGGHHVA